MRFDLVFLFFWYRSLEECVEQMLSQAKQYSCDHTQIKCNNKYNKFKRNFQCFMSKSLDFINENGGILCSHWSFVSEARTNKLYMDLFIYCFMHQIRQLLLIVSENLVHFKQIDFFSVLLLRCVYMVSFLCSVVAVVAAAHPLLHVDLIFSCGNVAMCHRQTSQLDAAVWDWRHGKNSHIVWTRVCGNSTI